MINARRFGAVRTCRSLILWASACALVVAAAPEVLPSTPASAASAPAGAGTPSFIFAPYNAATKGVVRASFHYSVAPGSTLTDSLVLANPTTQEQTFQIWSADGYNTTLGGALALRPNGYPMSQVGAWITLPTGKADYGVSPGQEVILNFALTVPPNAVPGDHVGGIEALDITSQPGGSGNKILVHEGIGVPIFINVPGPRRPSAAVTAVNAASSVPLFAFITGSSQARIGYQIANTGNTILRGKVHVWVTDLFGDTVKTFPNQVVGNLLPGQLANYPTPLWKSLPIAGPQTVHVSFTPIGSKTVTGSTTFWVIPWLLIILILLVLMAIAFWLWRRHRRKAAEAGVAEGTPSEGPKVDAEAVPQEPVPTT